MTTYNFLNVSFGKKKKIYAIQSKKPINKILSAVSKTSCISVTGNSSADEIDVEDSTFKFTTWTTEHLRLIASMLNKNGKLTFSPFVQFPGVAGNYTIGSSNEIDEVLKKINVFPSYVVPSNYDIPSFFPTINVDAPEVQTEYNKYLPFAQFNNLSMEDYWDKLDALGIATEDQFMPEIVKDPDILKRCIAERIQSKDINNGIRERVEKESYLPHIQKVLEQYFLNVTLRENVSPPIPSRYNEKISLMFYAKNKK